MELNEETAFHAKNIERLDIRTGDLMEIGFPSSYFDAITIYHVLEHLKNPFDTIVEVKRLLKKGGYLFYQCLTSIAFNQD